MGRAKRQRPAGLKALDKYLARAWAGDGGGDEAAARHAVHGLRESLAQARAAHETVPVLRAMAKAAACLGDAQEARELCEHALNLYPNHKRAGEVGVALAGALLQLGEYARCVEQLMPAVDAPAGGYSECDVLLLLDLVGTEHQVALQEDAAALGKDRRISKSYRSYLKEAYRHAFDRRPDADFAGAADEWIESCHTWHRLGLTCLQEGDVFLSNKALVRGICTHKGQNEKELWTSLARLYRITCDFGAALQAAGSAFQLDPFDLQVRAMLLAWDPAQWGEYFELERQTIASVQGRVRSFLARRRFRALADARQRRRMALRETARAVHQAVLVAATARVLAKHEGSLRVQCWVRQCAARRRTAVLRLERRRQEAATQINSACRAYRARIAFAASMAQVARLRAAATRVQRSWRACVGRRVARRIRRMRLAAREVQRVFRGMRGRERARRVRDRHCICIQRFFRGHLVRSGVREALRERRRRPGADPAEAGLDWTSLQWRITALLEAHAGPLAAHGASVVAAGMEGGGRYFGSVAKAVLGVHSAADAPRLHNVEFLLLWGEEELRVESLAAALPAAGQLRELGLTGCPVDRAAIEAIFQQLHLGAAQALRALHVEDATALQAGDVAAALSGKTLAATPLVALTLRNVRLGDAGCRALAEALQGARQLSTLSLEGNAIGPRGAAHLAALVPALTELHLGDNRVGDLGAAALGRALRKANLRKLYLENNRITNVGAAHLGAAAASPHCGLHALVLHGNWISRATGHRLSCLCAGNLARSYITIPQFP